MLRVERERERGSVDLLTDIFRNKRNLTNRSIYAYINFDVNRTKTVISYKVAKIQLRIKRAMKMACKSVNSFDYTFVVLRKRHGLQ